MNYLIIHYHIGSPLGGAETNYAELIKCPPPRKSLVKGERFIRFEGRPEHTQISGTNPDNLHTKIGACGCQ